MHPPPLVPLAVLRPERVALVEDAAGQKLVLKRVPRRFLNEPDALAAMRTEIRALERLQARSSGVAARLVAAGEDERGPWMLSTFLATAPLGHRRFSDPGEAFARSLEALATIHEAGVIHGDPSPDNWLVDDGGVFGIDFDLGRLLDEECIMHAAVRGTLAVAAPAVLRGTPPTAATDRYALAASFAAVLLGAPLRRLAGGPVAVLARGAEEDVPRSALDALQKPLADALYTYLADPAAT
jgi:serine/threonine protein kinase